MVQPPDDNRPDRGTIDGSRRFRDYPRSTQVPSRRESANFRSLDALEDGISGLHVFPRSRAEAEAAPRLAKVPLIWVQSRGSRGR